jgi:hypothetical protein
LGRDLWEAYLDAAVAVCAIGYARGYRGQGTPLKNSRLVNNC